MLVYCVRFGIPISKEAEAQDSIHVLFAHHIHKYSNTQ